MEKSNIENGIDIQSATIKMVVGPEWVASHGGADAIRILRYDPDTGQKQVLQTRLVGYDDTGRAVFEGFSPDGLSVFGLAGLRAESSTQESLVLLGEPGITDIPSDVTPETVDQGVPLKDSAETAGRGYTGWWIIGLIAGILLVLVTGWRLNIWSKNRT
ncbi:MAG: hypothetical protein PHV74_07545 [Dehalococcoidia bacterium]|nr:hypothetical protein [Dehalococcoidia bacterium]